MFFVFPVCVLFVCVCVCSFCGSGFMIEESLVHKRLVPPHVTQAEMDSKKRPDFAPTPTAATAQEQKNSQAVKDLEAELQRERADHAARQSECH